MKLSSYLALLITLTATQISGASDDPAAIGRFSTDGLSGWETKLFASATDYQLVNEDQQVLKATSSSSASGLFYQQKIDLDKTPILNWRWKIEGHLSAADEQSKQGDDYSARIYVVINGGLLPWRSKALNYVWSSSAEKESNWSNAFLPRNAKMLAVRNQDDATGQWSIEKRNVAEDLRRVFGKDVRYIDAVALMTDTDNTGQKVTAYYGDIYFTAD